MAIKGSEARYRLRTRTVRRIATLVSLLSLSMFAQIPDTSKLPIRSLHTDDGGLFIRLGTEVRPPRVFKVGGGVSPPKPVFTPDPEYSVAALRMKYQGTVVLGMVVETDGRPYGIKVLRSLDYGLNEKAIEAVQKWRLNQRSRTIPLSLCISAWKWISGSHEWSFVGKQMPQNS